MINRMVTISLLLLIVVSLGVLTSSAALAEPPTLSISPPMKQSVVNKVPEFYAQGASNGYSLKISAQGGSLSTPSSSMTLMPWGYVTTQWSIGTMYIIFLANVTDSDFHIGFLYLSNSSSQFALRLFDYQGGRLDNIIFDATPTVYTRLVNSGSVAMPQVRIQAKAQTDSTLSAIGPELYVNHNNGLMLNGTNTLKITAIQNQVFQGPTDYNELWSLLTDSAGNYFFGIFYMQNSDSSHVILEHQIRLNDYQPISGRTFNAHWTGGAFTSVLKVDLPNSFASVKVDGFTFQADSNGIATIYVPNGNTTVEAPNEIATMSDVKLHFTSWDSYGSHNPLNLSVDSYVELKANYQTQYMLSIVSKYGQVRGAGWYLQGANATFGVPPVVDSANGTRSLFVRFGGDYNSTLNTGWVTMSSPKHVNAFWTTQFKVTFQSLGVPANSTVALTINGQPQLLNGLKTSDLWVVSGSTLTVEVQSRQISNANANYNFEELQVNGQNASQNIMVTRPLVITIVFSDQQKAASSVSLKATPTSAVSGFPVTLAGFVSGTSGSSNVTLAVSPNKVDWETLGSATTAQGNSFSYSWTPSHSGTYYIQASWPGDALHTASSNMTSIQVQDPMPATLTNSDGTSKLIQDFGKQVNAIPILAFPIDLARSLLALGTFSANALFPSSPALFGYFIGSFLVGFVFIFPLSAVIMSIKAARSRRPPSAVWLTPLLTIWISALFLFVTNGAFLVVPAALVAASGILLVLSNTLLAPLAFSLLLARVVAG